MYIGGRLRLLLRAPFSHGRLSRVCLPFQGAAVAMTEVCAKRLRGPEICASRSKGLEEDDAVLLPDAPGAARNI